jgi:lipopolysaccharide/colanic/teichoic acid biosynthesis glycosyltransferase
MPNQSVNKSESSNARKLPTQLVVKRFMDVVGGLVGLGITSIAYIPIAIAIKLNSPGPVVFSQDRVGINEDIFRFYKFRTMYLNSEEHTFKPVPEDGRVMPVGRFLRQTSLDELPQFLNILHGEMSLVGPRPDLLVFSSQYENWQRRRFLVKLILIVFFSYLIKTSFDFQKDTIAVVQPAGNRMFNLIHNDICPFLKRREFEGLS